MLKLSKRLDYAVLAVARLSQRRGQEPISARQLSEESHIPAAILANILKELTRAGLVRSSRGSQGGYELAANPADLTIGMLVRTLEGPVRLVECVGLESDGEEYESACQLLAACPTKRPLMRLHDRIQQVLEELNFAELSAGVSDCESAPIPLQTKV